jgi:tricorn protease-like protein/C-terminal processing protease CtpA/Prc
MLRFPAISKDQIAFSYANDLWIAPKTGGIARPVTTAPGQETLPRFSPDGKTLAFVGNYDGNRDLYTIPVSGGVATRVTHHPANEALSGWTPDGQLLFLSNGLAGLARQSQLFTVPATGGLPTKLPVPYAGFGSISPDGQWLAYTLHSTDTRTWKRYRGGMATDVWLFNLKDKSSRRATDWEGTDTLPMWVPAGNASTVYYLSDNGPEHRLNIWAYTLADGAKRQVTKFTDDDVRWPSMGPGDAGKGEIIFQLGAELQILDLATEQAHAVKIAIPGDRPRIRPHAVDPARNLGGVSLSPSAKRVVVEARGDLYSLPAKEGVVRAITSTDSIAERDPAWSPDGRWIAYFSDETGEYELWVRPSDAKPAKDDKKKDADKKDAEKKDSDKKDSDKKDSDEKDAGDKTADTQDDQSKKDEEHKPAPEPRKLTELGAGYRFNPTWSPDSHHIAFTDNNGRIYITEVASGATREIDKDPGMGQSALSWSSDSQWLAYVRGDDENTQNAIWVANLKDKSKHRLTDPMFSSGAPAFDRKGEFLFFESSRTINNPIYSDLDLSFVYTNTSMIYMVPLNKDVKNPWLTKSDEESLKKDDKKEDKKKDDSKKDDAKKEESKSEGRDAGKKDSDQKAHADDGVSGTWSCSATGVPQAPDGVPFTLTLHLAGDGTLSGQITSVIGDAGITGTYDKSSGAITLRLSFSGQPATLTATLKDNKIAGAWTAGDASGEWSGSREQSAANDSPPDAKSSDSKTADSKSAKKDEPKPVKIDIEGFEHRAIALPIAAGDFGSLAVADGEKLVYVRRVQRGQSIDEGIKILSYKSDEPKEENVASGQSFDISADGKKLLVRHGGGLAIVDASAGGKSSPVSTTGLRATIDPRKEWNQIFTDAWRIMRDYFYEPTMHGLDWKKTGEHYRAMLADAASREDVNWIISEMISELNIGHAYLGSPGDVESDTPPVGVGMLGCDFDLVKNDGHTAYRIATIYEGAAWDIDARGPLSQPGVDAKVGDYILAVDGRPIDTSEDPWAAFIGTAGRPTSITLNSEPVMNGREREVVVKPLSGETTLRYRAWIERKRQYVEQKSSGKIGYIYVPNTGVDGQSDLFRQFYGQRAKPALIIDDRWNAGGQIPTRFIELLNRPGTNFWARRDGKDWVWPPDSHQGPKAMLINGLAGSGGDMFPWLFRFNKLGPLVGTRTWGGLVGISGNPGFIDGGSITVPTFGFYKKNGTWGIEGHGVDPDVEVLDDPAKMLDGGDPQIDKAVELLLAEIERNPFTPPKRPQSPDRRGMGIPPEQR